MQKYFYNFIVEKKCFKIERVGHNFRLTSRGSISIAQKYDKSQRNDSLLSLSLRRAKGIKFGKNFDTTFQRRISGMSKDESRSNRGYIHVYTEKDKWNRKNAKGSRIQRILRLLLLATVEFNLRNVQVLSRTGVVDGRKEGRTRFFYSVFLLSPFVTTT